MGDEYTFDQTAFAIPMGTRVLVTDGNGEWQAGPEGHFVAAAGGTLSETMSESYITADEGNDSTAQYFSVLETSTETILDDMSQINLDVAQADGEFGVDLDAEAAAETDQEVVLFRVDGSDELYGFQVAQDEHGNLQKYQFQVRQNANGQLETIPETIQVLPINDETINASEIAQMDDIAPEAQEPEEQEEQQELQPTHTVMVKEEFTDNSIDKNYDEDYTEEDNEEDHENVMDIEVEETKHGILSQALQATEENFEDEYQEETEPETKYSHQMNGNADQEDQEQEEEEEEDEMITYNQMYLNENNILKDGYEEELANQLQSNNEETEANHKMAVYFTEETEENSLPSQNSDNEENDVEYLLTEEGLVKSKLVEITPMSEHLTTLKSPNRIETMQNMKSPRTILIRNKQKENKTDRRDTSKVELVSVLKSSVMEMEKPQLEFDKRFAKGKFAVQAKQFQNFLSQTTIVKVPERNTRLPRKQKIKPLVRAGDEIVLQEIVVSSNGFIEKRENGIIRERKMLIPTECICLSDSDESSSGKRKRKKVKKIEEIIISDSEESEDDIPLEQLRVEYKCTKCPKTFPSEGSLNTHMQFHNYSEPKEEKPKYHCDQCNESFKNAILLNKHKVLHANKVRFECNVCKKVFSDCNQLTRHKRTHVKSFMFRQSVVNPVSPKKLKKPTEAFKCKLCDKAFSTQLLLNSHSKTHKQFVCHSCGKSFTAKLMFDDHVIRSCVKSPVRRSIARRSVFPAPKVSRVKCGKCDAEFFSQRSLLRHAEQVHKEVATKPATVNRTASRQAHCGIPISAKMNKAFARLRNDLKNDHK